MELSYWEIILRLFLAVLFGGAVGFEREVNNRPAGFRTHILVCVGSALIMIVSAYGFSSFQEAGMVYDPGRIAAQVITGIGFLGAGTIIQNRGNIQGLTTAAGIWVVSGIGLAVGIGFYTASTIATVIVIVSLFVLNKVDHSFLSGRRYKRLWIRAVDQPGLLGKVGAVLGDLNISTRKINVTPSAYFEDNKQEMVNIEFVIRIPHHINEQEVFRRMICIKGILEISWQGEVVFKA